MAKNEEKPCKLKKKWLGQMQFWRFLWVWFFFSFSQKIAANSSFFAKNENAEKKGPIIRGLLINSSYQTIDLRPNRQKKSKKYGL